MYDHRLFNQESGVNSGFIDDETNNIYDKRLFADRWIFEKKNKLKISRLLNYD